jgi:hypothetical protein
MVQITLKRLEEYRASAYQYAAGKHLADEHQAVEFVNKRGFAFLYPIKGIELPSLWTATAGNRPVPDNHDDPGHITWYWKDTLLDKRVWYYGRVLKHRNAFLSLETAPYFYALTPNFGSPEDDFMEQYNSGVLPLEAKLVFEALLKEGPLDTLSLRKAAHLSRGSSMSPFSRALDILQMDMRILPVSVCDAGRWHYAFVFDLTHRHNPEVVEKARFITENQAREHIVLKYLESVGLSTVKSISSLFQWPLDLTGKVIHSLAERTGLCEHVTLENSSSEYFAHRLLA